MQVIAKMKNFYFNKMVVALIIVFGVFFAAEFCIASVITINTESKVVSETIYVKDIATINASDALLKKINDIKIGTSPKPGKQKNIPASLIKARILSEIPSDGLEIILPGKIVIVKREFQIIPEESLRRIFRKYVENRLPGKKIKISGIKIKGNKELASGKLSLEVEEVKDKKISGHFRLIVNAKPETGKSRRILISGWIDRYENVVYAKNEIKKGGTINANNLFTELTNITKYPSDLFNSISMMNGQVAKTKIRKGVLIRQKMISISPAVKKGEMVKVTAKSGLLTVVTIGLATENAQIGEQIRVRNIKSKKIITGLVLNSKTVEVVF